MIPWRIWSLVVVCVLGGCLGSRTITPVHYYRLTSGPDAVARAIRAWPVTLGVRPFTAATRYRDRMLYDISEVEVSFYPDDRWVEPPEEMVTRVFVDLLHTAGLFQQVTAADDLQPSAWMLSGNVIRFDEVREARTRRAECGVRLELRRVRDEHVLWADVLTASIPLVSDTPAALAQAMSQAVQEMVGRLIGQLAAARLQP